MAKLRVRHLLIFLLASFVRSDRGRKMVELDSTYINALREASNQTNNSDSLNLPANASSIRENITDTFSCENRTYGYYADVDNDCQVFHVCLPSQTPGGRNVTYRWSFICPNETIFNQAVLTCTRPADSIDCEDSPDFYHLNNDIGKESNKTEDAKDKKDNRKIQKRKQEKRRENLVMENIAELVEEELNEASEVMLKPIEMTNKGENGPVLIEAVIENVVPEIDDTEAEKDKAEEEIDEGRNEEELDRIVMERNMRNKRQMRRGTLRFKGDI